VSDPVHACRRSSDTESASRTTGPAQAQRIRWWWDRGSRPNLPTMPAAPAHQDPLQDAWRVEKFTPDTRRRLMERVPRLMDSVRRRREGPGRPEPAHSERPLSH